jgi:hypothetical protein
MGASSRKFNRKRSDRSTFPSARDGADNSTERRAAAQKLARALVCPNAFFPALGVVAGFQPVPIVPGQKSSTMDCVVLRVGGRVDVRFCGSSWLTDSG